MSRRRTRRALRGLALAALLVLLLPIPGIVGTGLARDRDLAAAWRAWRAPAPEPVATPVPVAPAPFGPALYVGSLLDPELVEVSGLAASRRSPDLLWAVNDGGNADRLYALSLRGQLLHVGDNQSWRRSVLLWIVEEPDLAQPAAKLVPRWRIDLVYADGPRDCEAVAVDEASASVLLISKRTAPPVVYEAALAPLLRGEGGAVVAQPLARLTGIPPPSKELADALAPEMLHMPTALDLAPDGSAAVVLSYAAGWRFPRGPAQGWAEAFGGQPERIGLPPLALAEAVAYVGASLFVTSEVDRLSLVRWRAPLVRFDPVAPAGDGS